MQGQSPFVINLSAVLVEPNFGTSLTVLYNKFGRRLHTVGFLASDIYEEPRDLIDLTVTQPIAGSIDLKVSMRNLANKPQVLTRDNTLYERTGLGTTYQFQITKAF